jgi:hypothetical protein
MVVMNHSGGVHILNPRPRYIMEQHQDARQLWEQLFADEIRKRKAAGLHLPFIMEAVRPGGEILLRAHLYEDHFEYMISKEWL